MDTFGERTIGRMRRRVKRQCGFRHVVQLVHAYPASAARNSR
jgi:hypothetical protein